MFYKKFIYCYFIFYSPFISAHSFYKTMPKEVEHIYDELKQLEKDAISAFKKAYPNISADLWDTVECLEKKVQSHLSNIISDKIVIEEPAMPNTSVENKMSHYCFDFLAHECAKQGLDFSKIELQYMELAENTLAHVQGFNIKKYNNKEEFSLFQIISGTRDTFYYDINTTDKCIITIDIVKFINQKNYYKKHACKHELAHITEAHFTKSCLIRDFILSYYGPKEMQTNRYLNLWHEYSKTKELMAEILPALLSPEHSAEYFKNVHESDKGSAIHPDGKTLIIWLNKIHYIFLFKHKKEKFFALFNSIKHYILG